MKLIPGSKFIYSSKQKIPVQLGAPQWNKQRSTAKEFIQGQTYTLFSLNPQKDGSVVYTFINSAGNKFSKAFNSVIEAEEYLC